MSPAALALAAALAAGPALPEGAAHYRMELAGEHVGAALLGLECSAVTCKVSWGVATVLPEEAGGATTMKTAQVLVDREGRSVRSEVSLSRDGRTTRTPAVVGAVPAMIAPLVLAAGGPGCVDAWDEETGERGQACRASDGSLEVLGVAMRLTRDADGLPGAVELPSQRMRFVRTAGQERPRKPPRLFGTKVQGPPDASGFCGVPRDPPPPGPPPTWLPPARGEGDSCREIAVDWLFEAERAGHRARVAVGVVHTLAGWAWHAWDEVRGADGRWIPVDPTFGESPARSPRFTVARWIPWDEASRLAAGKRVLACWGERAR